MGEGQAFHPLLHFVRKCNIIIANRDIIIANGNIIIAKKNMLMDYKNIAMFSRVDQMILESAVMLFFRNECHDEGVSLHPQTPDLSDVQKKGEGVDKMLYL